MTSSISSLTALLLNPYAPTVTQAQPRGQVLPVKPVAPRFTPEDELELGALRGADTARPQASDTVEDATANTGGRQAPAYSFSDISKPRIALPPAAEATLFAQQATVSLSPALADPGNRDDAPTDANVSDAVFETLDTQRTELLSLAAQKQQRVASLYARNADITYNIDPIYSEAA